MNIRLEINQEDRHSVTKQTTKLIAEGEAAFEHILTLLGDALKSISQHRENALDLAKLDQATMFLGARFYSAAEAGLLLLKRGLLLPALAMSRDMVEILVVVQFLQRYPREAVNWSNTQTLQERRAFAVSKLWRKIPNGKTYKDQFDMVSAFIHTSSMASGGIIRPITAEVARLYLGGYYQPYPIANELITEMAFSLELVLLLDRWYRKQIPWPFDQEQLNVVKKATMEYCKKLKDFAATEDLELERSSSYVKDLSIGQLETLWQSLT